MRASVSFCKIMAREGDGVFCVKLYLTKPNEALIKYIILLYT